MMLMQFELTHYATATISSLIGIFVGTSIKDLGLRNYIATAIFVVLLAGFVVETWDMINTQTRAGLVGFCIGYYGDDVLSTINSLLPNFIRDTLVGLKNKLHKWLGIDKPPNNTQ